MAPNNALGKPTAAKIRERAERRASRSPAPQRRASSPAPKRRPNKSASSESTTAMAKQDAFGAGGDLSAGSVVDAEAVASRGVGSAEKTPVDEFEERTAHEGEIRNFFTGLMFVTRLPCPGWCDHHPGYLMRSMAWFPLLGTIVGIWAAAWFDAAATLWSPFLAAVLSHGATLWLTGCFHEDGLADTIDGFGGGWTKAQILRIMKESRVGSYALMGGSLGALGKAIAAGSLGESTWRLCGGGGGGPAILVAHTVARASSAPLIYFCKYVTDDEDVKGEFYNWFAECERLLGWRRVLFAWVSSLAIACLVLPPAPAAAAVITGVAVSVLAGFYGNSVLGGVMGDFLGATICMAELAIYLVLSADVARLASVASQQGLGAALFPFVLLSLIVSAPQVYAKYIRTGEIVDAKEC